MIDVPKERLKKENVEDVINGAKRRNENIRKERAAKAKEKPNYAKSAWSIAYLNADLDDRYVTPTDDECGIFFKHYRRFGGNRDVLDLLTEIVERWDEFRKGPLSWHPDMPRVPRFGFVAYHLRHFIQGSYELSARMETTEVDPSKRGKRPRRNWEDVKNGR